MITAPIPPLEITADKVDQLDPQKQFAVVTFEGLGYNADGSVTEANKLIWYAAVNGGGLAQFGIGNTINNHRLDLVDGATTTYRIVLRNIDPAVEPVEVVVTVVPFV